MKKKNRFSLDDENFIPTISVAEKQAFMSGISNQKDKNDDKILDPRAKPTFGINVRLNHYQMDLIRQACLVEERSQQQIIKRILIPALENIVLKRK